MSIYVNYMSFYVKNCLKLLFIDEKIKNFKSTCELDF